MKITLEERYKISGQLYTLGTIFTEAVFNFRNGDISFEILKEKFDKVNNILKDIEDGVFK